MTIEGTTTDAVTFAIARHLATETLIGNATEVVTKTATGAEIVIESGIVMAMLDLAGKRETTIGRRRRRRHQRRRREEARK
jgi:hypothetical protein